MSEREGLLRAVIEAPHEDARLVSADWLEEHGKADRPEHRRFQ
jgi:uncharacterized protein (TIGR02996 family)